MPNLESEQSWWKSRDDYINKSRSSSSSSSSLSSTLPSLFSSSSSPFYVVAQRRPVFCNATRLVSILGVSLVLWMEFFTHHQLKSSQLISPSPGSDPQHPHGGGAITEQRPQQQHNQQHQERAGAWWGASGENQASNHAKENEDAFRCVLPRPTVSSAWAGFSWLAST